MTKHIAIVGGPCTGKTEVIKELQRRGHTVLNEPARELIRRQKETGGDLLPNVDVDSFQKELLKMYIAKKEEVKDWLCISDTSIACGIAYYLISGLEAPEESWEKAKEHKYDLIFLLDFLDHYENDEVRRENPEQSAKIHNFIEEVHSKLGHKIIRIPNLSVEKRADLIEKHLKEEFGESYPEHTKFQ